MRIGMESSFHTRKNTFQAEKLPEGQTTPNSLEASSGTIKLAVGIFPAIRRRKHRTVSRGALKKPYRMNSKLPGSQASRSAGYLLVAGVETIGLVIRFINGCSKTRCASPHVSPRVSGNCSAGRSTASSDSLTQLAHS
jgi:hypothetical protein